MSLFFITPDELAARLERLCADLRLITLDLSCLVDVHGRQHTPSMRALTDELRRGLTSGLFAPTWVWDLAEPGQPAMAHREIRHSPKARRLYHEGWTWRQIGGTLRYGPCSPQ